MKKTFVGEERERVEYKKYSGLIIYMKFLFVNKPSFTEVLLLCCAVEKFQHSKQTECNFRVGEDWAHPPGADPTATNHHVLQLQARQHRLLGQTQAKHKRDINVAAPTRIAEQLERLIVLKQKGIVSAIETKGGSPVNSAYSSFASLYRFYFPRWKPS